MSKSSQYPGREILEYVDDIDSGFKALRRFASTPHGTSFAFLMQDGDKLEYVARMSQPCYGEMRPYGEGTLPANAADISKPRDLHWPFPDGNPLAVALPLVGQYSKDTSKPEIHNAFIEAAIGPLSPWRNACRDVITVSNDNGLITGLIFQDTHVEPTVLVSLFMNLRRSSTYAGESFAEFKKIDGITEQEAFVMAWYAKVLPASDWRTEGVYSVGNDYYLSSRADVRRLFDGNPLDLTGGTLFDRYAYDRPELGNIFGKSGPPLLATKIWRAATPYDPAPVKKLPVILSWLRSERDKPEAVDVAVAVAN
jgi:hypothetical protein